MKSINASITHENKTEFPIDIIEIFANQIIDDKKNIKFESKQAEDNYGIRIYEYENGIKDETYYICSTEPHMTEQELDEAYKQLQYI